VVSVCVCGSLIFSGILKAALGRIGVTRFCVPLGIVRKIISLLLVPDRVFEIRDVLLLTCMIVESAFACWCPFLQCETTAGSEPKLIGWD
jgi:hypothetical protein